MKASDNNHLRIIKSKDIQNLCNVSKSTAYLYYRDIKQHYEIKKVTNYHLYQFLKIPIL